MSSDAGGPVRVLVVEDEQSFVDALTVGLEREGFEVHVATDGAEALRQFGDVAPDIVLLDLMLPKLSGLDVCREIRATSSTPIVMVSAKGSELDVVVGLEIGADDYVTKPYRMRELVARMRAVLRRHPADAAASASDAQGSELASALADGSALSVGGVVVDIDSHEVMVDGAQVALPLKEFELLTYLMEHRGRVVERAQLIARVWGVDYVGATKTLDVHVKRLRSRIEVDPANPTRILTIRGVGYKYAREP